MNFRQKLESYNKLQDVLYNITDDIAEELSNIIEEFISNEYVVYFDQNKTIIELLQNSDSIPDKVSNTQNIGEAITDILHVISPTIEVRSKILLSVEEIDRIRQKLWHLMQIIYQ